MSPLTQITVVSGEALSEWFWPSDIGIPTAVSYYFFLLIQTLANNVCTAELNRDCFIATASIILQWKESYSPYNMSGFDLFSKDACAVEEQGEWNAAVAIVKQILKAIDVEDSAESLDAERQVRHGLYPAAREATIDPAHLVITEYLNEYNPPF
jgi:hypothetical protein